MQSWPAPEVPRLPGQGPAVRVRDTASAELRTLDATRPLRMYVCGITPYDAAHLGHAFTYLTYDLLARAVRDAGGEVVYVQNVTDVDDPLLERAERDGLDWRDLAATQIARYREDMAALRMIPPAAYIGVVEAIPLIVDMIAGLADRGAVYSVEGDLYFPIASADRFGEVSHLSHPAMTESCAANGGDPGRPGKKDPVDPLLWRAQRPGEPSWPSPFGPGRPGWHIECAAIARRYLGNTIDIQGGGTDLIFPHHESSAAHAEVATGAAPFAQTYVHTGLVWLDGHKMSKSRGNLEFVSRLRAQGVDPAAIRLALLGHHYSEDWEWSGAELEAAAARLARWRSAVAAPAGPAATGLLAQVRGHLAADLDAPAALAAIDRWVDLALSAGAGSGGSAPSGASGGASEGPAAGAPRLVEETVDALLGVDLSPEEG
ncbi:MAG: cysteine--1-D-myo-inosityl 2-amino-2-deoxy-alpha-D-glucopyranoside ligase [Frankia sp.]